VVLCRKPVNCSLKVGMKCLPHAKEFKCLWVLFTREGKTEPEVDRRLGAAAAENRLGGEGSIYWSVHVPTPTHGHELCVVTERTRSQMKMSFLRKVSSLSLREGKELGHQERVCFVWRLWSFQKSRQAKKASWVSWMLPLIGHIVDCCWTTDSGGVGNCHAQGRCNTWGPKRGHRFWIQWLYVYCFSFVDEWG